jgi:N-methylhydantoinase B
VAVEPLALKPGDTYTIRLPGGGGYGDPASRPRALVRADVADGYVSAEAAARIYGLVQD